MNVEVKWKEGMSFTTETPSGHTMKMDSGPAGTETDGPTPMEVMLGAAAVCSGMDVVSILEKRKKIPEEFAVSVEAERAEKHPKYFTKVHLVYKFRKEELKQAEVEKAVKIAVEKYCSVINNMTPNSEMTWECQITE